MSAGRNWTRVRDQQRMAERGSESIDGGLPEFGPPKARPSKSAMRAEADAALAAAGSVLKKVECECGHKGEVRIPAGKLGSPMRCSRCGRRIP